MLMSSNSPTDAELLERSASDPRAYRLFYERWAETLTAHFYRRTWDVEVVADLLAETFAVAYTKRHKAFFIKSSAGPWLYRIAEYELKYFYRKQRVQTSMTEKLGVTVPVVDDESAERIVELVDLDAMRPLLLQAMESISASERDAVKFRVIEELDYRSISQKLSCSEQAARVRVHRGLANLAKFLEKGSFYVVE